MAFTVFAHLVPEVFTALKAKTWEPGARLSDVLSMRLFKVVNFFTPSTHTSMREMVPVTVAAACTGTGEATVEPFAGLHTFTPGALGALHAEAPLTVAVTVFFHFAPAVLTATKAKV